MKLFDFHFPFTDSKQPWWIEVQTQMPDCIYYFGPFDSKKEAQLAQMGYIDDLVQEQAQDITVRVKKTCPKRLTVCETD